MASLFDGEKENGEGKKGARIIHKLIWEKKGELGERKKSTSSSRRKKIEKRREKDAYQKKESPKKKGKKVS